MCSLSFIVMTILFIVVVVVVDGGGGIVSCCIVVHCVSYPEHTILFVLSQYSYSEDSQRCSTMLAALLATTQQ